MYENYGLFLLLSNDIVLINFVSLVDFGEGVGFVCLLDIKY